MLHGGQSFPPTACLDSVVQQNDNVVQPCLYDRLFDGYGGFDHPMFPAYDLSSGTGDANAVKSVFINEYFNLFSIFFRHHLMKSVPLYAGLFGKLQVDLGMSNIVPARTNDYSKLLPNATSSVSQRMDALYRSIREFKYNKTYRDSIFNGRE